MKKILVVLFALLLMIPVVSLNAKEKARQKKLSLEGGGEAGQEGGGGDTPNMSISTGDNAMSFSQNASVAEITMAPKKGQKKIPKFMQRAIPTSEVEFMAENFRMFEKWILNLMRYSESIMAVERPDTVLVNITDEFDAMFDKVNENKEENGVIFKKLDLHGEKDIVKDNLELYGGFFTGMFNKNNNF